jgi:hypothetical protein
MGESMSSEAQKGCGNGNPLFKGMHDKLNLKLLKTKTFRSGNILLYYEPITKEDEKTVR